MAIKIKGDTIIDNSRVIVNADKIGIGTTNPHVALEIFNGDVGIGTTDPNAKVENTNTSKLAVGFVTANTFFGNLVGGISDTGDVTVTGNLVVEGNTTLGDAASDTLTVNATSTFEENVTFKKNVSIGGTLTYEDVTNVDSIGLITARTGIHVLGAGITVTGFSTYYSTVEFKDNVGIGTTNPTASNIKTALDTNTKVLAVGIVTAKEYYGEFKGSIDPGTSITKADTIQISDDTSKTGTHYIHFGDQKGDSGNEYDGVEVDSTGLIYKDGKVGIGSTSPDASLDIEGTSVVAHLKSTNNNYVVRIQGNNALDKVFFGTTNANDFLLANGDGPGTNNPLTERLRITAGGNVGIGTQIPTDHVRVGNTAILAVGIVSAYEYYGTFKGIIDPGAAINKANKADTIKITEDDAASGNLLFQSGTSNASTFNITVTTPSGSVYEMSGSDRTGSVSGNNQPVTINVGDTINFAVNASNHPFYIRTALGSGNANLVSTPAASNQGTESGTVSWTPNTSGTYYYQCGNHGTMYNTITVRDEYFFVLSDDDLSYDSSTNTLTVPKIKPEQFIDSSNGTGAQDYVIKADGNGGWTWGQVEGGSVGTLNFTDLNDTPANYTGDADKVVVVNSNADGLTFTNASSLSNTYDLSVQQSGNPANDDNPLLRLSDGTNNDDIEIVGGANVTVTRNSATKLTIEAVNGAGVGIALSAIDVLRIDNGDIGGVNPGLTTDALVYWHEDATYNGGVGKLDHLKIGTGLKVENDELKIDTSIGGKTYELPVTVENGTAGNGGNSGIATVILRETGTTNDDPVTIKAGSGIVIDSVTDGFKISADISGGGGGGISTVDVIQYSDNADPRNVRSATNPIDVQESVGIVTIGIGTTSNAYGNRFLGPDQPSGAVEGDIWYDTTTLDNGIERVAIIQDEKPNATNGGRPATLNNWLTRDLNTIYDTSTLGITSTSDGKFSLPAGSYAINISVPGYHCGFFQARLAYNVNSDFSGTTNYVYGSSQFSGQGVSAGNYIYSHSVDRSRADTVVTLSSLTYFRVEQNNSASDGGVSNHDYGQSASRGVKEIYTQVRIKDLTTVAKTSAINKIQQGDTKAEVIDTNGNGHFLVETEGSERLRITKDGSALFNGLDSQISSDTSKLAVKSAGDNIGIIKVYCDGGEIDGDLAGISFDHGGFGNAGNNTNASRAKAAIAFRCAGGDAVGYGRGDLCFYVDNATDNEQVSADDERLRITRDGNIGIGTTNPTASNIKTALDTNTKVLAVGIVTCNELYVDGNQITGSGGSGSGGGNYASYITSLSGNDEIEFTNIPSWATKITLLGENILLPDTNPVDSNGNFVPIGEFLTFGGDNNGYLTTYTNLTSFITLDSNGTKAFGLSEHDNTPYAPYILLYSIMEGNDPVLNQLHFTFEKVKGQNKWVYSGSSAGRKGNLNTPPTTSEDIKFLNEFAGSFTANEAITKLKLSSLEAINFTGGTLTAIYEGEGGGSGGSGGGGGSSFVLLSEESATGTEVEFDNIPADAQEITVMFKGVSLNANNSVLVQLGYSNTWIASGYDSSSESAQGTTADSSTGGFIILNGSQSYSLHGSMIINKASSSSYTQIGQFKRSNTGAVDTYGSLSSVSGTVTRLKVTIKNQNNQDAFDAGTISVSYKTSGSGGSGGGGANVSIDVSPPSSANAGDLWWDSDDGDLHVYYKDTDNTEQWVAVSSNNPNTVDRAKAWVNFDGTFSTSPFTLTNGGIRAAFNVSSVTDRGVGQYTINFANDMDDTNYCVTGMGADVQTQFGTYISDYSSNTNFTRTKGSVSVFTSSSQSLFDPTFVSVAVFGN